MKKRRINPTNRTIRDEKHLVNHLIRTKEVRIVGGDMDGLYPLSKAIDLAKKLGLDLVEISSKSNPPICKIIDYSKFKYERKKKLKEIQNKAEKSGLKEISFSPNTGEHDLIFKSKHIVAFLKEGFKVRVFVKFRGREFYTLRDVGKQKLEDLAKNVDEYGKIEDPISMRGRRVYMTLVPAKKEKE